MALRSARLINVLRHANIIRYNTSAVKSTEKNINKLKEIKTEGNLKYLHDPDTFGTLSGRPQVQSDVLEDEGDIREEEYIKNKPLRSQQLTIKQYADLIKQYIKHKRLKEAIDILEVRMLKEDRVQPENYIYNILIGACAKVGYTRKAFKLYNDMKRRSLVATGDTYTCLFESCANSPWAIDGLKNASHLRNLMIDKGVEPNLTNYNAMIKAFGRCGDLPTAFKIVDEMRSKNIKIRVHTFNHLLHACISDKETGLRHALVVWRKMLRLREKPNIYSFNLMLKCVKECNLGSKEDIEELMHIIYEESPMAIEPQKVLQIESANTKLESSDNLIKDTETENTEDCYDNKKLNKSKTFTENTDSNSNTLSLEPILLQFVEKLPVSKKDQDRTVPNLLSKKIIMNDVLSLQEVESVQDKFAIVGGQEDFLKEMEVYSVKPDIKTFTQMLVLLDDNIEAENKMLETMKSKEVKADIDFYNMLIKKRSLRSDYENALAIIRFLEKEDKFRKRRYPNNKKLRLKPNVMTYGVLALACKTKESAEKLLCEMEDKQLRVNVQILGTLLRHGTAQNQFDYVVYIMNTLKKDNISVNDIFLKHIEAFNDKCADFLNQVDENGKPKSSEGFQKAYKRFSDFYTKWLKDIDIEKALQPEHPWQQFREDYPETVQRLNHNIKEPKKFYKRDRRFVKYAPRL